MTITVKKIENNKYYVHISLKEKTVHIVTLNNKTYHQFKLDKTSKEDLIKSCFLFLLDREPNTSILKSFNLQDIGTYFPEFREKIYSYL